jgi:class 3 adenylate cyclase
MDYTAMGQTVHLASRLEQLAREGTALLSSATLALVEGYVQVLNQSQGETRRVNAVGLTEFEPAARARHGRLAHPLETG